MDQEIFLHRNGGGRIVGAQPGIGSDCYLSRDSMIEGKTFVSLQSSLTKASVKDSSVVSSVIFNSPLLNSHIAGSLVSNSALESVIVRATGERQAVVQDCLLGNDVVVEACTVRGIEVNAPVLIHRDWNRTPRHHLLIPCDGVQMSISECSDGGDRGHCGCECRTYAEWLAKKDTLKKIFTRRGWHPDSIEIIRQLFEEWQAGSRSLGPTGTVLSIAPSQQATAYDAVRR